MSMNKSILAKYKSKARIAIVVTAAIVVPTLAEDNELKVTWKDTLRLESADGNNKLKFGGPFMGRMPSSAMMSLAENCWKTVKSFVVPVSMFPG
ncbi:hypothetical protein OAF43_01320 [bacterium]|nr:hypothetical protein [bacterium]